MDEWKVVQWQRGQRKKAFEAIFVAKLATEVSNFPPLLFNMVLHPGNLGGAESIIDALAGHCPGVRVNPFPAQSAFLHEESALRANHAASLKHLIDIMADRQVAAAHAGVPTYPLVARLHYWLMLQAVFDWAKDDLALAMRTIAGEGIWRCYQADTAGRYLQVGMGGGHQVQTSAQQHPGGYLGCFWNTETVTSSQEQVWNMRADSVRQYLETDKQTLACASQRACPGCAFPRLNHDMLATETGMSPDLLPFYFNRRAQALGF
jgi:hypothetical protein